MTSPVTPQPDPAEVADRLDVALANHPDTECPPLCEIGSLAADTIRLLVRQKSDLFALADRLSALVSQLTEQRDDQRSALAAIGELTVADRPYDWRIEQIVKVLDSVKR